MMLEDLVNHQNEFVGAISSLVQDKTAILGRDLNSDLYLLLEDNEVNVNLIAPAIEATWFKLAKENKLNIGVKKQPAFSNNNYEIGEVQTGPRLRPRDASSATSKYGHESQLVTEAKTELE